MIDFFAEGSPVDDLPPSVPIPTSSDLAIAYHRLRALVGDAELDAVTFFVHPGAPVSKSRAKFSRKTSKFYTPTASVDAQDALADVFLDLTEGRTLVGAVAMVLGFYRPNFHRIDIDNLTKLVMDAGTQAKVWKDDCQVVAQTCYMELDIDNPRTVVAWCEVPSTLDRSRRFTCVVCGQLFYRGGTAAIRNPPKHCSRECLSESRRRDRALARCPRCGTEFKRNSAGQRYCGKSCAAAERWVRQRAALQRPKPTCSVCGGPVSRREYTRCVGCSPKGRPLGSKNSPNPLIVSEADAVESESDTE